MTGILGRGLGGLVVLAAITVGIVGCSAPENTTSEPTVVTTPQPPTTSEEPAEEVTPARATLPETASKVGCTGYEQSADIAPGAEQYGTCQLGSARIQLYLFANADDRQLFLDTVSGFGIVESQMAFTPDGLIAAAPSDATLLEQLKTSIAS